VQKVGGSIDEAESFVYGAACPPQSKKFRQLYRPSAGRKQKKDASVYPRPDNIDFVIAGLCPAPRKLFEKV
jgi:hypothetical protein